MPTSGTDLPHLNVLSRAEKEKDSVQQPNLKKNDARPPELAAHVAQPDPVLALYLPSETGADLAAKTGLAGILVTD